MGGSSYSADVYATRASLRAKHKVSAFAFTDDVKSGKVAAGVHPALDPKGVKVRESRDSDAHPESLAIAVFFDVTGSMGSLPKALQAKLSTLMALLISKGVVEHPQVLFGAVGDANSDRAPLQVGQFESGNEMEDDLSKIYLEGNGGGQFSETYELAHYFMATRAAMDCLEKRGKKGYLFTMGDEAPYTKVRRDQVKALIGDDLEADLALAEVIKKAEEKFHVFHLIIEEGSYRDDKTIESVWRDVLGQRAIKVYDHTAVCEIIATTIALEEGIDLSVAKSHLADAGVDASVINTVERSLATYAPVGAVARGSASGVAASDDADVERL